MAPVTNDHLTQAEAGHVTTANFQRAGEAVLQGAHKEKENIWLMALITIITDGTFAESLKKGQIAKVIFSAHHLCMGGS